MRGDVGEQVIFGNTASGLFNGRFKDRLSEDARRALRQVGMDLDQPLLSAYALDTWEKSIAIAIRDLWPDLPEADGYRELGRQVVLGIRTTLLGKAVEQLLKIIGPRRALQRMNQNFRTSDNFVESRLTELSPTSVEMWISHTMGRPTYYEGILLQLMEVLEVKSPRVELVSAEGVEATFRISWGG